MRKRFESAGDVTAGGRRGSTLVEACAAIAISALAAAAAFGGLRPLECALRVEAGRGALVAALREARRLAYEGEGSVSLRLAPGSGLLEIAPGDRRRELGDKVTVASAPADGEIEFRASGLADNATVSIACGDARANVVVNQRGVIR